MLRSPAGTYGPPTGPPVYCSVRLWATRWACPPGLAAADLVRLAVRTARGGGDDAQGWPSAPCMSVGGHRGFAVPHPHDPGVVLGNLAPAQGAGPVPVEAVVSLCRTGTDPILRGTDVEHLRVWLVDSQGANANLHYVLDQAARHVLRLRQEGKRVLLHCFAGQSRTPAVAAVNSHLATCTESQTALNDLRRVLTSGWYLDAHPQMHEAAHELTTGRAGGSLVAQFTDSPGGGEYHGGWDPYWLDRYPAW
ncbi:protein-tyrosine phosphatase family protein [Streptomyces fagopyri]|uniref:hypothetical protein n=1 Tax=Streptomyces fagopyri TaxID=2662397 RepID=UPI0037F11B9F